MKKNRTSNNNRKPINWDNQIKLVKKLYPDGKLPERELKVIGLSQKEYDDMFEKIIIPQTKAMLKTAAGRRKLRKAGLID